MTIQKTFYISAADFSSKQEITQTAEGRMIQVNYSNMMKYKETMLPGNVVINTFQPKGKSIDLDYNNITFNEALSFPYSSKWLQ
jgi:hypothetical protein